MRKELDIYASLSLIRNMDGKWATRQQNVDIAMIRENTEGEYSGLEHTPVAGVVESLKVVTREKTERIARFAFDFALKNGRKKVTCIHKANIMKLGDGLFLKVCRDVAKEYESSGIKFEDMIVDNASMQLVSRPSQFDVIVCGNLYGNILSNIGAALIGGPGIVPGANIGRNYAVFEPGCRHVGKAIQGSNTANPTALLLSSIHMLRSLELDDHASRISNALHKVLADGRVLTPDLDGTSSTTDFTLEVIANLTNASGHEDNGSGGLRASGSGGVGSTDGGSGGGRGPFNPFNQRGEQTVSIDLDSSSSSVTDVGEEDWQSIRRLSEPPAPPRPAFSTNPIAFMRALVAPNLSSNAARQQDLELSSYYKSNHPVVKHQVQMEKEMMDGSQPSTPATLNGRRRLSLAFLQDMVPMENEDHIPMGVFMGSHLDRALRLSHAQSSKITLGFLNEDVEADYRSYFWSTMKKRWSLFIGIGGSIAIAVQVAGLLGKSGDGLSGATTSDWGVLAGAAILPIVLIASLPFILKDAIMARH
ncbi:isocitrate dehydrogenase (NAD(+)) idh1, partial [Chytriomyces hyalinus]